MGSNVFTPIRGRRMRVTRVNSVGRPTPGRCAYVVAQGFINCQMSAEVSEGETTEVRAADGSVCVSERGADSLNWYSVSIEFCKVDPDLFSLINPTWTKLVDYRGETIGWEESHSYSIDEGWGLEVWSDVTGYVPTDPNAQGAWVYYLLPWIVGGTVGDITIENGAVSFTIQGRTKKGSQWGKGPYDIMSNPPDGSCGPLITPFNPDAPRRIFLTTCPPPESMGGCQPLSSPEGPAATIVQDTSDTTRLTVQATVSGLGPFTVDWGDGTVEDLPSGVTGKTHRYGSAGTYIVAVYPSATPTAATYKQLTVPFTGAVPSPPLLISLSEDPTDLSRMSAELQWANTGFGTVRVEWGDGTSALAGQAETGTVAHVYPTPGAYTLRVIDESDVTRKATQVVEVPFGPVITVTESETNPLQISVTVNNTSHGDVTLGWGDGTTSVVKGDNTTPTSHVYQAGGTYTLEATDVDETSRTGSTNVTVAASYTAPTLLATEEGGDVDRRSVRVSVTNPQAGAEYEVRWTATGAYEPMSLGTASPPHSAVHTYDAAGPYSVTVRQIDTPAAQTTQQVVVPFSGPVFDLIEGVDAMSARVTVTGSPSGTYEVRWVSGGAWTSFDASATPAFSAAHTYAAPGTYPVSVRDQDTPTSLSTQQVTIPFP